MLRANLPRYVHGTRLQRHAVLRTTHAHQAGEVVMNDERVRQEIRDRYVHGGQSVEKISRDLRLPLATVKFYVEHGHPEEELAT